MSGHELNSQNTWGGNLVMNKINGFKINILKELIFILFMRRIQV